MRGSFSDAVFFELYIEIFILRWNVIILTTANKDDGWRKKTVFFNTKIVYFIRKNEETKQKACTKIINNT